MLKMHKLVNFVTQMALFVVTKVNLQIYEMKWSGSETQEWQSNSRFLLSSNLKLLPKYFIVILIMDANRS